MSITMIGLDTAKSVFQGHGIHERGPWSEMLRLIPSTCRLTRYWL
jgi:hypothetical protein